MHTMHTAYMHTTVYSEARENIVYSEGAHALNAEPQWGHHTILGASVFPLSVQTLCPMWEEDVK